MGTISFFNEGIGFELKGKRVLRKWVQEVLEKEGATPGDINFIFCGDETLHAINQEYLGHDTLTDIVTFDLGEDENITADIYVSIERVKENARELGVPFREELHRVMIHGILHLLGYEDKSPTARKKMRIREDECLKLLENK